jgi:hypothetical protein
MLILDVSYSVPEYGVSPAHLGKVEYKVHLAQDQVQNLKMGTRTPYTPYTPYLHTKTTPAGTEYTIIASGTVEMMGKAGDLKPKRYRYFFGGAPCKRLSPGVPGTAGHGMIGA